MQLTLENLEQQFDLSKEAVGLSEKTATLVDASGFIYRAFYGMDKLTKKDGTPIGAVYGFCSMILAAVSTHKADIFAIVFDSSRTTFRNQIYQDYKSNRAETPPDLIPQFSIIKHACDALNISKIEQPGFEADDIIATYTKFLSNFGYNIKILSSDKDLMQLINDKVCLFDCMKSKTIKASDVISKFGISPEKMIDFQSLTGDRSDNIPGIEGIGPKTAAKLLNQFDTAENMYNHIDKIQNKKLQKKLIQQKDKFELSKKLVTLRTDADINQNISELQAKQYNKSTLRDFFIRNELWSLANRV